MIRQSEEYVGRRCTMISVVNVFLGADFPSIRILAFSLSPHSSISSYAAQFRYACVCDWSGMADNQAEMSGCEDSLEPQSGPPSRRSGRAVSLPMPLPP